MMERFTALDLQRRTDLVQEAAIKEPVAITDHGEDLMVLMSTKEYHRLKRRDRQCIAMSELPEEFLAALAIPIEDRELAKLDLLLTDE